MEMLLAGTPVTPAALRSLAAARAALAGTKSDVSTAGCVESSRVAFASFTS